MKNISYFNVSEKPLGFTDIKIAFSSYSASLKYEFQSLIIDSLSRDKQAFRWKCVIKNYFSYFSVKTYVVGTQKNRLTEKAL